MASAFVLSRLPNPRIFTSHGRPVGWDHVSAKDQQPGDLYSTLIPTKLWQNHDKKKNALKMCLMSWVHKVSSTKLPCVQLGCGKLLMVVNALAAPKKTNSPGLQEHHLVAAREWVETICIWTKTWDAKIFQFPGCQTWDATLESRDLSLEPQKTAWLPELPNITQGHWISSCWSCWSCWSWCLWCKT